MCSHQSTCLSVPKAPWRVLPLGKWKTSIAEYYSQIPIIWQICPVKNFSPKLEACTTSWAGTETFSLTPEASRWSHSANSAKSTKKESSSKTPTTKPKCSSDPKTPLKFKTPSGPISWWLSTMLSRQPQLVQECKKLWREHAGGLIEILSQTRILKDRTCSQSSKEASIQISERGVLINLLRKTPMDSQSVVLQAVRQKLISSKLWDFVANTYPKTNPDT